MIIENLKKNITKYIATVAVIFLIFTKPSMSLIMKIMNNG